MPHERFDCRDKATWDKTKSFLPWSYLDMASIASTAHTTIFPCRSRCSDTCDATWRGRLESRANWRTTNWRWTCASCPFGGWSCARNLHSMRDTAQLLKWKPLLRCNFQLWKPKSRWWKAQPSSSPILKLTIFDQLWRRWFEAFPRLVASASYKNQFRQTWTCSFVARRHRERRTSATLNSLSAWCDDSRTLRWHLCPERDIDKKSTTITCSTNPTKYEPLPSTWMLIDKVTQIVQLVVNTPQALSIVILTSTLQILPTAINAIIAIRRIFIENWCELHFFLAAHLKRLRGRLRLNSSVKIWVDLKGAACDEPV